MFDTLLFPVDENDGTTDVFEHVLDIATTHDSTVHILNVADTTRDSVTRIRGDVVDTLEQEGKQLVRETADRVEQRGVSTVTDVRQGDPYRIIIDYAEANDIDLVAMPTHGRQGLERLLLGSTTERVVRRSDVPVLTIQPDAADELQYPYEDVLVPTDGSDCANQALAMGVDVVSAEEATLHLLSVIALTSLGVDVRSDIQQSMLEGSATELLDEAAEFATNAGVESVSKTIEHASSIPKAILSYINDNDVNLVVIGTHGRTGFDRYMLGSVTESLIRTSPIPVLTVREPVENGE
ncbi:universal stress protein [Haloterrigena sp. H1]|uniref:universal stress protein n=1 Tax=Haloterrigena sp. H1 TaxID=2552943 RepID=UPI00110F135E|nr:universal stress protein [Haloterrigena sp. H1]TMT81410.1 universal stress protein [Haloterrigena sp. H1]